MRRSTPCHMKKATDQNCQLALCKLPIVVMQAAASSRCGHSSRPRLVTRSCASTAPSLPRTRLAGALLGQRHRLAPARASEEPVGTSSKPQVPATPPASQNGSSSGSSGRQQQTGGGGTATASREESFSWNEFINSELPGKLGILVGLIVLSRVGVYIRLPGVDIDAFAQTMSNSGLMGYVDGEENHVGARWMTWGDVVEGCHAALHAIMGCSCRH